MEKLQINRTVLLSLLTLTGKVIPAKGILPILECYRFQVNNDGLTVTGSNMEVFISKTIPGYSGNIDVAIPANKLHAIIKALPEQELVFSFTEDLLSIKSKSGKYTLPIESANYFPTMPELGIDNISMPVEALIDGINRSVFAVGAPGQVISGVFVEIGDGIKFTATDKRMMSSKKVYRGEFGKYEMIVPVNVLNALNSHIYGEYVDISYTDKNILFSLEDGSRFTSILIDAKYLDYTRAFNSSPDKLLKVNRSEFAGAIRRAMLFANLDGRIVLNISEKEFTISGADIDFKQDAVETIEFEYIGEPIEIGLIGSQVLTLLSKQTDELAYLLLSKPNLVATISDCDTFDPDDVLLTMSSVK